MAVLDFLFIINVKDEFLYRRYFLSCFFLILFYTLKKLLKQLCTVKNFKLIFISLEELFMYHEIVLMEFFSSYSLISKMGSYSN